MSPDFLVNYLAVGLVRSRVPKETEKVLPAVLGLRPTESLPVDVITLANTVREQNKDYPEYVIRRKVRDALDAAKSRAGQVTIRGVEALDDDFLH